MKIHLKMIRDLNVELLPSRSGLQFISAASGLLKSEDTFYVISDDQLHLGIFTNDANVPGKLFPLFEGTLPQDSVERKKVKPDLESILFLPQVKGCEMKMLLAVPSGSTLLRRKGALLELQDKLPVTSSLRTIDFQPLFAKLEEVIPALNIEGIVVKEKTITLFHRGNSALGKSALIQMNLGGFMEDLSKREAVTANSLEKILPLELGSKKGVKYSFTDAAMKGNEIWFLAAAEATDSTYEDGEYLGATLGRLDSSGKVDLSMPLDCPYKPEGLFFGEGNTSNWFFIATDSDNPSIPSKLYFGEI